MNQICIRRRVAKIYDLLTFRPLSSSFFRRIVGYGQQKIRSRLFMALKMRSFLPYQVPKAQVKELWSCLLVSIPPKIQFHLNHSQSPPSYLEGSAMEKKSNEKALWPRWERLKIKKKQQRHLVWLHLKKMPFELKNILILQNCSILQYLQSREMGKSNIR